MGKFNMASMGLGEGMLNQYSQNLKQNFETVNIDINEIEENENNKYSITNIDELVEAIRTVGGLEQNLEVMKTPNGKYKLLTGHRRLKALHILADEDKKYQYAPCKVTTLDSVNLPVSDLSKEKYLINITNSTQRDMTDADKYNQYQDLREVYTEARNNGFVLSEKMRVLIANDMKVSPAQVGKMDYINNNATDELKEQLTNNEVSIAAANEIAHLDETEQSKKATQKKERIIDTLDQDFYPLDLAIFNDMSRTYAALNVKLSKESKSDRELSKKEYAKVLKCKENILKELDKLKNIIDK